MNRHLWLIILAAAILLPAAAGAQDVSVGFNPGIEREMARAIGLEPSFTAAAGGGLSPLGSVVPDDQLQIFSKVMRWKRLTIVALGINTGAILVAFIEPFVGNILGILSLGFYTISAGYMAFGYVDLISVQNLTEAVEPNARPAYMASVITAGFGMGALTALGFAFDSSFAAVLGMICTAVSGVSGIVAIIRTNRYAEAIDYDSYAMQVQGTGFQGYFDSQTVPPASGEQTPLRVNLPLIRYSY